MTTAAPDAGPGRSAFLREDLVAGGAGVRAGDRVRLAGARCPSCGRVEFPRRDACPGCGAAMAAVELSCEGRLGRSTSVLHPAPGAVVEAPYHVGVAELPEGISVLGLLVSDVAERPPVGVPLETVAVALPDGRLTYGFRPCTCSRAVP